jgi:hypothetical protein
MVKAATRQPIHVAFVCHSPSLWGKIAPLHTALLADPTFKVSPIAVPYRHGSFGDANYHDGGMTDFFRSKGIPFLHGWDEGTKQWLDLQTLAPDYVFFQTPYDDQFPPPYTSRYVSLHARVCYVPYVGVLIYRGAVEAITHPPAFFQNITTAFVATSVERDELLKKFTPWLTSDRVVVAGSPMADYARIGLVPKANAWKRVDERAVKRILWTPRWRTDEGNCHFFDYKDFLLDFVAHRPEVDFLLRPHPLCLQNFAKTGEFTKSQQEEFLRRIAAMPNANVDSSGDYQGTLLASDILISDMSSILAEYFITGKPIIYTHRVDSFNEIGAKLAQGFYWVRNSTELGRAIQGLLSGDDPLKPLRDRMITELFSPPTGGSCEFITNHLRLPFC